MPKFKVTFEVLHDGKVIIEKQQTYIEIETSDLVGPDLPDAIKLTLERARAAGPEGVADVDRKEEHAAKRAHEILHRSRQRHRPLRREDTSQLGEV